MVSLEIENCVGLTLTTTVSADVHPSALAAWTTYSVVRLGVATGLKMFGLEREVVGVQEKFTPPVAFSCADSPAQIV